MSGRLAVRQVAFARVLGLVLLAAALLCGLSAPALAQSPPTITKAFGAASVPLNGTTSLTFSITNPNPAVALSGVAFSDNLPAGLVIATPSGLAGSCGAGTITATQGSSTISLSGASLPASGSCTFSVNVTGVAAGMQNNTTGNVTSVEGGTGGTASASLSVLAPPSIAKVFNPSTIAVGATTSLTFTLTNPSANAGTLTGVAFTDALPAGLTVPNASATVCGGTVTLTAPNNIAMSGATIAANGQCQFSVTVTGTAGGIYTNTTGNVTSTNGGVGNTASAGLSVASPPTITKAFGAASVPLNGATSLTFSIANPNAAVALSGVAFTDNLPAGLVVASPTALTSTCGGTATAVAGSGSMSLSGGTLAPGASCTVSVNVQGTTAGSKNNSVQVSSANAGVGNVSNASLDVVGPPVLIKFFGAASIPLNGTTSLGFIVQNNNPTTSLSGIAFTDALPAGLVVATPNGLTGSCGAGTITATQGASTVSLSGASVPASGSCTFSVNVTGIAGGMQNNTTGNVTSVEGGTGGTASASLSVLAPPSIAKVFNPSTIAPGATTSLTFTITNPPANAAALTGVAFTDILPPGLSVPNASATVCGGTVTLTAPSNIAMSGASVPATGQCVFSVTVTGLTEGQYTNTTGSVTAANAGTGNTASANLSVAQALTIVKTFGAASMPLNGTTTLTFSLHNAGLNAATGVTFTDNMPAGLVVAATPNVSNGCGGAVTAVGGSSSVALSGASLAGNSSCVVSVAVQGTSAGVKNNTVQVSSNEAGAGNTSNASVTVVSPPVLGKAFGTSAIALHGSTTLQFTIQNSNASVGLTGIGFTDPLPAGLVVASPNGVTGSCGTGSISATPGSTSVSLSGGALAASSSCTFSVNVTATAAGAQNNITGNVTSTEGGTGGTASASLTVTGAPIVQQGFGSPTIALNGTTTLNVGIQNPNATVPLTGLAFTDTLPGGMTVAPSPNVSNTCGGTVTAVPGSSTVTLVAGTVGAGASCAVGVTVRLSTLGSLVNQLQVSSAEGGVSATSSATLLVSTGIANVVNVPTLSQWALVVLALALLTIALAALRRRRAYER